MREGMKASDLIWIRDMYLMTSLAPRCPIPWSMPMMIGVLHSWPKNWARTIFTKRFRNGPQAGSRFMINRSVLCVQKILQVNLGLPSMFWIRTDRDLLKATPGITAYMYHISRLS